MTPRKLGKLVKLTSLAFVLVLACLAIMVTQLLQARNRLTEAANEITSAAVMLRKPEQLARPGVRVSVGMRLLLARRDAAAARGEMQLWSPLIDRLSWVPIVGRQLASADPASAVIYNLSGASLSLIDGVAPALSMVWRHPARSKALPFPLVAEALTRNQRDFVVAEADVSAAKLALTRLHSGTGSGRLDRQLPRVRADLKKLGDVANLMALLPGLVGMRSPARYLFCWQDPAELRATGGFIGAVDLITLDHGRVRTDFSSSELYGTRGLTTPLERSPRGRVLPHEITWVPPPLPEAVYTDETSLLFRDSNFSPDFPLSARLERWFYGEDTGRWATGVIDFVDSGVVDILGAAGPVYLTGYHRWINASNAQSMAQFYVNSGKYYGPLQRGNPDTIRKQFFGAVMQALVAHLERLPLAQWPRVAGALGRAVERRDILIYDREPSVQKFIVSGGADGGIHYHGGDYLFIVDDNRGYTKVNPYVHEWATYHADVLPNLWLDVTLRIHYSLGSSPATIEGEPASWRVQGGSKHDYTDFLRVYTAPGATLDSSSGLQPWAPTRAYGLSQFAGLVFVREHHSQTVTLRYTEPANIFARSSFHRYTLEVQRQPGGNLTRLAVTVRGFSGVRLSREGKRPESVIKRVLYVATDAHMGAKVEGPLHPELVKLGPGGRYPDPYIPFTFIRDARHPL